MKKLISVIICFIFICPTISYAEENKILTDKLSSIWLSPEENADVLEKMKKVNEEKMKEDIELYLIAPGYAREKIGISADDEKMISQVKEMYSIKENQILKVYHMKNNDYSLSYANNNAFRYLISDDYYLYMDLNFDYQQYEMDGSWYKGRDVSDNVSIGLYVILDDGFNYLRDVEKLKNTFMGFDISSIVDIKFVAFHKKCTGLYIDCGKEEYVVSVYNELAKNIETYKLYDAKEFMQNISDDINIMNIIKSTFEEEALSLQSEGLLNGTDKGLDLLKPLTRIETATMLLRAMGEETLQEENVQTFADVSNTHWGYGAAEKAYSLGLVRGVGDNLFAPDGRVTKEQFATMVLRAGNYGEFNWEDAFDILISEGIISAEESQTMDFFTRGDMAKIIYEAKNKGMIE